MISRSLLSMRCLGRRQTRPTLSRQAMMMSRWSPGNVDQGGAMRHQSRLIICLTKKSQRLLRASQHLPTNPADATGRCPVPGPEILMAHKLRLTAQESQRHQPMGLVARGVVYRWLAQPVVS